MSDYRTWQVDDRVVCIDDSDGYLEKNRGALIKGEVYEIAEIDGSSFSEVAVRLTFMHADDYLRASRFRKIHPRSTSKGMSILTDILKGARVPEGV